MDYFVANDTIVTSQHFYSMDRYITNIWKKNLEIHFWRLLLLFVFQLLPLGVATADHPLWSAYWFWHRFYAGCPSWRNPGRLLRHRDKDWVSPWFRAALHPLIAQRRAPVLKRSSNPSLRVAGLQAHATTPGIFSVNVSLILNFKNAN